MVTESAMAGGAVHAERLDADWFVHRSIRIGRSGHFHGVEIRYPIELQHKYGAIAREIRNSLAGE